MTPAIGREDTDGNRRAWTLTISLATALGGAATAMEFLTIPLVGVVVVSAPLGEVRAAETARTAAPDW